MRISFLLRWNSSQSARNASLIFRSIDLSIGEEQVLGELLGQRRAALHDARSAGIGHQRTRRAYDVDAEMLVEAAVLGGEHRLDKMFGKLFECHRIVVADAAPSDLVAVAVLERDGEVLLLQPVVPAHFAEGRNGQGQHEQQADDTERQRLRMPARRRRAWPRGPAAGPCARNTAPRGSTARVRLRSARRRSRSRMSRRRARSAARARACPGNPTNPPSVVK